MSNRTAEANRNMLPGKYLFIIIGLMCCLPFSASIAQDIPIPAVTAVVQNDSLKVRIAYQGLFQNEIRKTLLAGLPVLLDLDIRLTDSRQQSLVNMREVIQINYDVWEEFFSVSLPGKKSRKFSELASLQQWLAHFESRGLQALSGLSETDSYGINVQTRLILLSRKQNRQLNWWLQNGQQTEEDLPSRDRSTGFKLDLTKLVQIFVSRGNAPQEFVFQSSSKPFTLSEITGNEKDPH